MNNTIKISKISKTYEGKKKLKVLNNISYTFKKGKIYSLVGPSGSGKTTLLNILSLLDYPTTGKLKIFERKIFNENKDENDNVRANSIGIIYQNKNLLSDFNVLENVYLASLALNKKKLEAKQNAKKLIKKVGLSNRLNHFPSELSGGESQRVAICRAIINKPTILLADEPTGNLDQKNSKIIFKILFNLINKDRIIIFATHNRYFADLADYKIELIDGKLKASNAKRKRI